MRGVVSSFALRTSSPLGPRIGLVTFSGCVSCSQQASAETLYVPSADAAALLHAIDNRPDPNPDMPLTCISCGLSLAQNLLSAFGRAEAMTLVLVLTDGEQTVWGGDNAAMAAAEDLKATGTSVVTLSLGMKRTQPNRHLPPPASA